MLLSNDLTITISIIMPSQGVTTRTEMMTFLIISLKRSVKVLLVLKVSTIIFYVVFWCDLLPPVYKELSKLVILIMTITRILSIANGESGDCLDIVDVILN